MAIDETNSNTDGKMFGDIGAAMARAWY